LRYINASLFDRLYGFFVVAGRKIPDIPLPTLRYVNICSKRMYPPVSARPGFLMLVL
jgi:hypothetical protein